MNRESNLEKLQIAENNWEFLTPYTPRQRPLNRTTDQLDGFCAKLEPRRDCNNPFVERKDDWYSDSIEPDSGTD